MTGEQKYRFEMPSNVSTETREMVQSFVAEFPELDPDFFGLEEVDPAFLYGASRFLGLLLRRCRRSWSQMIILEGGSIDCDNGAHVLPVEAVIREFDRMFWDLRYSDTTEYSRKIYTWLRLALIRRSTLAYHSRVTETERGLEIEDAPAPDPDVDRYAHWR